MKWKNGKNFNEKGAQIIAANYTTRIVRNYSVLFFVVESNRISRGNYAIITITTVVQII